MVDFLDKIRAKPEQARKRIAFFSTSALFAVIVMVWWATFTAPVSQDSSAAAENVATPLGVVQNFFNASTEEAKNLRGRIMNYAATGTAVATDGGQVLPNDIVSASDIIGTTSVSASDEERVITRPPLTEDGRYAE